MGMFVMPAVCARVRCARVVPSMPCVVRVLCSPWRVSCLPGLAVSSFPYVCHPILTATSFLPFPPFLPLLPSNSRLGGLQPAYSARSQLCVLDVLPFIGVDCGGERLDAGNPVGKMRKKNKPKPPKKKKKKKKKK